MPNDDRLRIAVFIDFDNIEIGVKNTLNVSFDAGLVLEALRERGEVVSKCAYSDWQRAGGYSRMLTQHAIRMVQRNLTPGGDKNGADINLALDALEMAFTHSHINAYVIVGGDSDFISLVEKLKQYDKKVFIVGGRGFTSHILQRNCSEFIAYENLIGASTAASPNARRHAGRPDRGDRAAATDIAQAIPLVTRALKVLADREVSPQLGLLKSTLLQLDSTFSERTYGVSSFRDFAEKLERAGVLKVHHAKGGWIVAPAEAASSNGEVTTAAANGDAGAPDETAAAVAEPPAREPHARSVPAVIGTATDGVRELRRILGAAEIRRWPMYLRNVKQAMRQVAPSFDERAYGFPNLTELLRAAHKDGVVRVDRDRQGIVRVFQGAAPTAPAPARGLDAPRPAEPGEPLETDMPDPETIAIGPLVPAIAEPGDDDSDGQIATGAVAIASAPADGASRRRRPRGGASSDAQRRPRGRRPKA